MTQLLTLGASLPVSWPVGQLVLKSHCIKMCFGIAHILSCFQPFGHYCIIQIDHAKTSLPVNCAGDTQGVHLLGQLNMGQV